MLPQFLDLGVCCWARVIGAIRVRMKPAAVIVMSGHEQYYTDTTMKWGVGVTLLTSIVSTHK